MPRPFTLRAVVDGKTILDIEIGHLFMIESTHGVRTVVDAKNGVLVEILEDHKPILQRTYTERELYPFKDDE
jgi:hypothetical protein